MSGTTPRPATRRAPPIAEPTPCGVVSIAIRNETKLDWALWSSARPHERCDRPDFEGSAPDEDAALAAAAAALPPGTALVRSAGHWASQWRLRAALGVTRLEDLDDDDRSTEIVPMDDATGAPSPKAARRGANRAFNPLGPPVLASKRGARG